MLRGAQHTPAVLHDPRGQFVAGDPRRHAAIHLWAFRHHRRHPVHRAEGSRELWFCGLRHGGGGAGRAVHDGHGVRWP